LLFSRYLLAPFPVAADWYNFAATCYWDLSLLFLAAIYCDHWLQLPNNFTLLQSLTLLFLKSLEILYV